MAYIKNRIIHRFIRDIKDYEEGGACFGQVLPTDTQVYADYTIEGGHVDPEGNPKTGLYYVIGDGVHTYTEIRDGYGEAEYNIEYKTLAGDVTTLDNIQIKDLKDGNFLRYDKSIDRWVNIHGALVPLDLKLYMDVFDCEYADAEADIFVDGGNAGDYPIDLLDAGRVSDKCYCVEFVQWLN